MVTAVRGWKNVLQLPGTEEVKDALTKLEEDTEKKERERNVRQSRTVLHKTINTICPVTQVLKYDVHHFMKWSTLNSCVC